MTTTTRRVGLATAAVTIAAGMTVLGAGSALANGSYFCHSGPDGAVCAEVMQPTENNYQARMGIQAPTTHTICGLAVQLIRRAPGKPDTVVAQRNQKRCVTGGHLDMLTVAAPADCYQTTSATYVSTVYYAIDGGGTRFFDSRPIYHYCLS